MSVAYSIARRINGAKGDGRKVSRPVIRIATLGVALGLAIMIISVSVILGFKHTIRDKVVGMGSHITVANFMSLRSADELPICISDSMKNVLSATPGVSRVELYIYKQGILKTNSDFLGIMFKGVGEDCDTTFLSQCITEGCIPKFSSAKSGNRILISSVMADKLRLHVGDKVYAYFLGKDNIRARKFTVSGVYETNLSQYDATICFTDLYTARKLNGWEEDQYSGAALRIADFEQLSIVAESIIDRVNRSQDRMGETFSSATVQELNPQIFSWLDLLDVNVWIILALMVCVAVVTMISGLLIIILERTQMIGILKALGARNTMVRHTFMWFAALIIAKGLLIGNILGIGIILLQQFTGVFTLDPKTYYVSTVPVELNLPIILALNAATMLINICVLVGPSFLISRIHPARSMRYE